MRLPCLSGASTRKRRAIAVLLLSEAAVLQGCYRSNQSINYAAGEQAVHIKHLFTFIFWICVAVFTVVLAVLLRGVMRHKPDEHHINPESDARAARTIRISVAVTLVALFAILFASVVTGKQIIYPDSKNPVVIEVVGHQWWWEVNYPNSDPSMTVTTANEIHVPVGEPVMIKTSSQDVIHSFWAPSINGKRDLIPGYSTSFWIKLDKPGTFRGQCAEFCGMQHAHMAFFIMAQSKEDFAQWLDGQRKSAMLPATASAQHGQQIFLSSTCVMCHTIRGTPAGSRNGPDLTHLASRQTIAAGTLSNTRGNLGGWIADSQSIKPGNKMPPNPLPAQDLNDLIDYLQGLR